MVKRQKVQNNRALSPWKHGATAGVLPGERRAWQRHLETVREALRPADAVEEELVQQIALALWRLRRLAVWEGALLEEAREKARGVPTAFPQRLVDDAPPDHRQGAALAALCWAIKGLPIANDVESIVASAREALDMYRAEIAALDCALANPATLDNEDAAMVGWHLLRALANDEKARLAAACGVSLAEIDTCELRAGDVTLLVSALGDERTRSILQKARQEVQWRIDILATAIAAYEVATRERQARARPDWDELGKLQRYESHLWRLLYRALHELEARQARRRGDAAPLGRLEVYGAPELTAPDD